MKNARYCWWRSASRSWKESPCTARPSSVKQLRGRIDAFIESYNQIAKPFVWTKAKVHQRRFKDRHISQL
jgi:hypothetical protein